MYSLVKTTRKEVPKLFRAYAVKFVKRKYKYALLLFLIASLSKAIIFNVIQTLCILNLLSFVWLLGARRSMKFYEIHNKRCVCASYYLQVFSVRRFADFTLRLGIWKAFGCTVQIINFTYRDKQILRINILK